MPRFQTELRIPEAKHVAPGAMRGFMEMLFEVARLKGVPNTASWRAFKRGERHFYVAEWQKNDELT